MAGVSGEERGLLPTSVRRALQGARELPERVLQRPRHNLLRRRLAAGKPAERILVVCLGNICRSPYMEAVLSRRLPQAHVTSAGFMLPGRAVPSDAVTIAARRGYDLSANRSRVVTHEMVRDADLVVAMDEPLARRLMLELRATPTQLVIAGDLDPVPFSTRRVRDPWEQPVEVFEACFDRLDRCAWTLASSWPDAG